MNSILARQQQELAEAIRADAALTGDLLKPTPTGEPARLSIYSAAYRARLGEALKENYPILARVLGDDAFAEVANTFLSKHPSRTASIRWFGARLAEFTELDTDTLPHPALSDLIRMEWALNIAFDGPDAIPLNVNDMLTVVPDAWPALQFFPHPTMHLLEMNWNVEPLWSALSADENAETEPPEPFPHHLLIWRYEHRTQWRSVEPIEAQLLQLAIAGKNFAQLCEAAAGVSEPGAAEMVAGYLRNWVGSGLLAGFKS